MSIETTRLITGTTQGKTNSIITDRRALLRGVGTFGLSAAAVAVLGGCESMAASKTATAADVDILNVALGLEHEAINAYQLGAESGLLQDPVLQVAVLFQSHHKGHRDALVATIQKLGGKPVAEKSMNDYAAALNAGSLKSQAEDSLRQFEEAMRDLPEVRECHMLNGEIDFILKIVSKDLQSFQEFLTSKLTPAPNVASVKTSLTIRTAKQMPGVPLE